MKNPIKITIALLALAGLGLLFYFSNSKNYIQDKPTVITTDPLLGCYVAHLAKDIYTLNIQSTQNKTVVGMLAYNNAQKDSSSGKFTGTLTNDILLGTYSFDSEGMHSDSTIVFKKVGESFIQGFGPTKIVDNKEAFVDVSTVNFDPNSTFIKSVDCTEHFTDSSNVVSFDYNPFFHSFDGNNIPTSDWRRDVSGKGILLASVTIPRTYLPGTNFSDTRLTVGRSTESSAIKNCLTAGMNNGEIKGGIRNIGGYPFTKFSFGGAGAGNFYDTTSYRGIFDGDCYAIEYTTHSTNIGNYSPDQGVKEFDKQKIEKEVEQILNSFKFLISSN